jgi:nucleotide-binding universal stress UspA family protein
MRQKVLVPLDGSRYAEVAIPVAARIARATHGELLFVHVMEIPVANGWYASELACDSIRAAGGGHPKMVKYLCDLAGSEILKDIPVSTEVVEGDPAEMLLKTAQTHQATLIVMNSQGKRGVTRWLLGSVAAKVSRHSSRPVLVLRSKTQEPTILTKTDPMRILVTLDGSVNAEQALGPAALLTSTLSVSGKGALHLACVFPFTYEDEAICSDLIKQYLADIEKRLLASDVGKDLVITSSFVLGEDVAQALVDLAEHGKGVEAWEGQAFCDVIAMTTHGRSGVARWVMGSITERVLDTAHVPLLIVRASKQSRKNADALTEEDDYEDDPWLSFV